MARILEDRAQRSVSVGAAAILGRARLRAADADRIPFAGLRRLDALDLDDVLPVVRS
jgi:hypothetical protein